jgi:hypothetical protein
MLAATAKALEALKTLYDLEDPNKTLGDCVAYARHRDAETLFLQTVRVVAAFCNNLVQMLQPQEVDSSAPKDGGMDPMIERLRGKGKTPRTNHQHNGHS